MQNETPYSLSIQTAKKSCKFTIARNRKAFNELEPLTKCGKTNSKIQIKLSIPFLVASFYQFAVTLAKLSSLRE